MTKATIHQIGRVEQDDPKDWAFDCHGKVDAIGISEDGRLILAGYSIEELREIAARRDEFILPWQPD